MFFHKHFLQENATKIRKQKQYNIEQNLDTSNPANSRYEPSIILLGLKPVDFTH